MSGASSSRARARASNVSSGWVIAEPYRSRPERGRRAGPRARAGPATTEMEGRGTHATLRPGDLTPPQVPSVRCRRHETAMTLGASASTAAGAEDLARRRADILARLERQIDWYERVARQNNVGNKVCMVVGISTAAAIAVMAAAGSDAVLVAGLGALVVVAQGVQEVFQFQANW